MNTGLQPLGVPQRLVGVLVGVCVVVVVLNPPRLEGVHQRREHDGAYDVLQQLVLTEAAVTAVVSHHEELRGTVNI